VIIFTNFIGKLHLPFFFLSLTNIIIRYIIFSVVLGFIIIFPTLTIITLSFICIPSWLLVTIWVRRRLYKMHIRRLGGGGGRSRILSYYRMAKRQIFQLVRHQVCILRIFKAYHAIGVTHYFGHLDDDFTSMCSSSQNNLLPEKISYILPLQN
jgi:hypothetical protein